MSSRPQSHRKAIAAHAQPASSRPRSSPVTITGRKGDDVVDTDEGPRADTTADTLAKLRPAFAQGRDDATVTAGNASSLNDGAAALVVTSQAYAEAHGLSRSSARIARTRPARSNPQDLFFAPITAVRNLMKKEGTSIERLRPDRGERSVRVAGARRWQQGWAGTGIAST